MGLAGRCGEGSEIETQLHVVAGVIDRGDARKLQVQLVSWPAGGHCPRYGVGAVGPAQLLHAIDVITAENGFEALSKVARHNPDLIFVDIMMPRLDGYQTCAIIKNNAQYRATPVVMLTSKDGLFDQARGRVVGSDLYLTKPFTKEELLAAVSQHAAA